MHCLTFPGRNFLPGLRAAAAAYIHFRHGLQSYFSSFLTRLLCSCPALLAVTLPAIATRRSTASHWQELMLCFEQTSRFAAPLTSSRPLCDEFRDAHCMQTKANLHLLPRL